MMSSLTKQIATNAEIMWATEVVMSKSIRLIQVLVKVNYLLLFPDSDVAKDFSCGKTKCSYLINHAVVPCVNELLTEKRVHYFVALFDESLS